MADVDALGLGAIAGKFAAGGGGGKGLGDVLPSHDQAEAGRLGLSGNLPEEYEAIRVGRYKLIEGIPGRGDWYGEDPSAAWGQGRNDVHGKQNHSSCVGCLSLQEDTASAADAQ